MHGSKCVFKSRADAPFYILPHILYSPLTTLLTFAIIQLLLQQMLLVLLLKKFLSFYRILNSPPLATVLNHLNRANFQTPHSFRINFKISIPSWLGLTMHRDLFLRKMFLVCISQLPFRATRAVYLIFLDLSTLRMTNSYEVVRPSSYTV